MLKEYGCKTVKNKSQKAKKVEGILEPMKLALNFVPDKDIKNQLKTIDLFLESYIVIMALFDAEFDQGDYCMGLLFGMNGAEMLLDIVHISLGMPAQFNENKKFANNEVADDKGKKKGRGRL